MGPVILALNTLRLKIRYELHESWRITNVGSLERHTKSHSWDSATTLNCFHVVETTKKILFYYISEYRDNFLRLEKFVMIGGPNDTVITPWQSAHLGFYDQNEVVQPFEKQPVRAI